jgi:hypothetical protein
MTLHYTRAGVVSMSSSPGFLHSKDDFYATPNLVVLETTNSVFNHSLYEEYITPKSVLSWQRAAVATGWAGNGEEWTELFSEYNSGSECYSGLYPPVLDSSCGLPATPHLLLASSPAYNNQWMVVDMDVFTPGKPLRPGTLWIAEQIPGTIQSGDVTAVLNATSYWGSYNIPYFTSIYDVSGYPAMFEKYGADYSYSQAPRAQIFRRNESTIASIGDVKLLMRYNNFEADPLSGGNSILGAVAARGDLASPTPSAFGGVDSKVTANSLMGETGITVDAICGPTHVQQPVFSFTGRWENVTRAGVPTVFDFEYITVDSQ